MGHAILIATIIALAVLTVLLAAAAYVRRRRRRRSRSPTQVATSCRYEPGQIWSVRVPGAPEARLTILRVDSIPGAEIFVHVSVSDVPVTVGHMPFTADALDRSVAERIGQTQVGPELLEGYDVWKRAFENEGAGVFSVTVAQALKVVG